MDLWEKDHLLSSHESTGPRPRGNGFLISLDKLFPWFRINHNKNHTHIRVHANGGTTLIAGADICEPSYITHLGSIHEYPCRQRVAQTQTATMMATASQGCLIPPEFETSLSESFYILLFGAVLKPSYFTIHSSDQLESTQMNEQPTPMPISALNVVIKARNRPRANSNRGKKGRHRTQVPR